MIEGKAIFAEQKWSSWKLDNHIQTLQPETDYELTVEENYVGDIISYGEMKGRAKEPFFGSLVNMFMRFVSGFLPGEDFKYAYLLDFKGIGRVQLYICNEVWSSHADILSYGDEKDLTILANAAKDYIRYRCFVDSIQPLEAS